MSLAVYGTKNFLKTCLQPFVIRSYSSDTVELAELIDVMAQGRTTLSKPDITGCLQLFVEELVSLVADGKHVKTPVGAFYLSANGKLDNQNQSFTPGFGSFDHGLTLHFRTNKNVEALIKSRARWDRVESFDTSAALIAKVTTIGGTKDDTAQAGDTLRLTGRRLKFDGADTTCGLFLEAESGSWRVSVYPDISPSKVIAILPADIPVGTYDLVISTMPNGKNVKEGYYEKPFTIE